MKNKEKNEEELEDKLINLLKDKGFIGFLKSALELWNKHLQTKNEQHKEQMEIEKEKLIVQKEKTNLDSNLQVKSLSVKERLTYKWLWCSGIVFTLSLIAIGILGYLKVIPEAVTGTLLAAIIGYVFGKATTKKEEKD